MKVTTDMTDEIERIVNRHIARLLQNLEDSKCPIVYIQAVKSEMQWLRSDLKDAVQEEHP